MLPNPVLNSTLGFTLLMCLSVTKFSLDNRFFAAGTPLKATEWCSRVKQQILQWSGPKE